ncbi:MAG: DUF4239 domain-containing protein [Variovorax sp.]|nr:MAG: DUF4239 domain-containing protein [Variovorax sp.]
MNLPAVALFIFALLVLASVGVLFVQHRLPARYHEESTRAAVRTVANIFVVMTSLVLGLMLNTTKNRFDAINRDVHAFATDLILLDRTLQLYGQETAEVRQRLKAYVARASDGKWTSSDPLLVSDQTSEQLLHNVGAALRAIRPSDDQHLAVWNDARQEYRRIVEVRWALLEQSEGSIPVPLLAMVVAWLVLIFANFGYGAVRNSVVVVSFVLAAALISGTLYLILDLDAPFTGPIQVSSAPLERVLAEMRR